MTTIGELSAAGVLSFGDGYRTKLDEHGVPGFRILRVGDVANGRVDLTGPDFVSERMADQIGVKAAVEGDVILTTKGTVGRVAVMPAAAERVVYSPQICYFRVHKPAALDPRFLAYWFQSAAFWRQASHRMDNTDMAAYINLADVRSLDIDVPDRSVQRAIADVLGALDDKIAANRAERSKFDELAAVRYRRALAEGSRTTGFFEAFDVDFGEPFASSRFSAIGEGRPLIRIRDLQTHVPQVWSVERRARESVVRAGDVLVGMDGEFAATIWLGDDGVLNQRVCRVASGSGGSAFVREAIRAPLAEIERGKVGTTVIHLNKADLERTAVTIPDPDALRQFEMYIEPLFERSLGLVLESRPLTEMRETLLPALMSGRLHVREAQEAVAEAEVPRPH